MVVTDAVEGLIDSELSFHYDVGNDVLYLRKVQSRDREAFGEETTDGILLHDGETDELVGWTSVNWWKHLDRGPLPDSLRELTARIEAWAAAMAR